MGLASIRPRGREMSRMDARPIPTQKPANTKKRWPGIFAGPSLPPKREWKVVLECASPIWCSKTSGAVVAGPGCAEVARSAATVTAAGHIVQGRTMAVQVGAIDCFRITCQGEDAGDDGRRRACAAVHVPAVVPICV